MDDDSKDLARDVVTDVDNSTLLLSVPASIDAPTSTESSESQPEEVSI